MSSYDRIVALLSDAGFYFGELSISDAEVLAYCRALEIFADYCGIVIDEEHIPKMSEFTRTNLNSVLADAGASYIMQNGRVILSGFDEDKIGAVLANWFPPNVVVIASGAGRCWNTIDNQGIWSARDAKELTFNILDTMEDIDE